MEPKISSGSWKVSTEHEAKVCQIEQDFRSKFWLTRIVFIRCISLVYQIAFITALQHNKQLIGDNGLTPMKIVFEKIQEKEGENLIDNFQNLPTLFWILKPWLSVDKYLDGFCYVGIALSSLMFITGRANSCLFITLWSLYLSIANAGGQWYNSGWDNQILETGFLAIWTVPFLSYSKFPQDHPPPWISVVFFRWLVMRITLGIGLARIKSEDICWRNLTCTEWFYETQPLPNSFSYFAHQSPKWLHQLKMLIHHFSLLVVPMLTLMPQRSVSLMCGTLQILFQFGQFATGNFSFQNPLTIVSCIWFFDDNVFKTFFKLETINELDKLICVSKRFKCRLYRGLHFVLAGLLAFLSIPVVQNFISSNQSSDMVFDGFRLVKNYGGISKVPVERLVIVLEGTADEDPRHPKSIWLEYDFHCNPGNLSEQPCSIAPFDYKLDWKLHSASSMRWEQNPWLIHLAGKLLLNDPTVGFFFKRNPFHRTNPPRFIRASLYKYKFSKLGSKAALAGQWWRRKFHSQYMMPFSIQSLQSLFDYYAWNDFEKQHILTESNKIRSI